MPSLRGGGAPGDVHRASNPPIRVRVRHIRAAGVSGRPRLRYTGRMPSPCTRILTPELIAHVRSEFQLDWRGIHGVAHWARVRHNGLTLARDTGADVRVVELFAFLHDVRREHDGHDVGHGERAAELARELGGRLFELDRPARRLLETACRDHSDGYTRADPTVQTCWDADRLDLGRVGVRPKAEYLCTEAARNAEILEAAYRRSVANYCDRRTSS